MNASLMLFLYSSFILMIECIYDCFKLESTSETSKSMKSKTKKCLTEC